MDQLDLLPYPRSLTPLTGTYTLGPGRRIVLDQMQISGRLLGAVRRLQTALREQVAVIWEASATTTGPENEIGVRLRLAPDQVAHPQGYALRVTPARIEIDARTEQGLFYGICTLIQLIEQHGRQLPCLEIADWPDFAARGVMLDISRDKVPRMETLFELVDMLAGWKINQLQLYTEHTFAYREHPEVWVAASPLTGDEILELDEYCSQRYVELVPNQNSFGHMHRYLTHPRYAALAEIHGTFQTQWGPMEGPFSLCPIDPGSLELVRSLYDELLPHFRSRMFNVGCDETFDLGQGRSREACAERGTARVYLDYLQAIYADVKARGRTMQFWGDIIIEDPELVPELPRDIIALEWGYEAEHPFSAHCQQFENSQIPFYVCPGTSAWCSIAGRTENALGNLRNAADNGMRHGAEGYLITDWGDRGHWQGLPVSYPRFSAGAAYAWAFEANRELDMARAVSIHAFRDQTGAMGRVAYDLGNVYRDAGLAVPNGSALFWGLQLSFDQFKQFLQRYPQLSPDDFERALPLIDQAMAPLAQAHMARADAVLIGQEFELTARLMRHACRRGLLALGAVEDGPGARQELADDLQEIIATYEEIWLRRNRPDGLEDSVARLRQALDDYQERVS